MHGQMRNLARAAVVAAARSGVGVGAVAAAEAAAVGGGATTRALATRHVGTTTTTATMMAWHSTSSLSSSSAWGAAAGHSVGRHLKGSGWRSGGGGVVGSRFMSSGAAPKATVGQGPVGWMSLGMVCITGGGLLYYYEVERSRRMEAIKAGPSAGKASIGGPFTLQNANENGKKFSTTQLHGKFALLYFGFTMCPDICPDELEKMSECVDLVAKAGKEVVPVFISIDPERDTVKRVKEYVKEFHPKLVGLTGSVEACKDAARQYRVYYHRTGEDGDPDYLVDHSIIMYLVDTKGEFVTFYGKNYEAPQMAEAILEQMKRLGQ